MNETEPKYPNSAGRLLAILQNLQPQPGYAQQLIPIILDKKPPNDDKLLASDGVKVIIELHRMYASFLEDLENADMEEDERAVLTKGLSSLDNLMFPLTVNQNPRAVSESEKALLEVCATRLTKENVISETDTTEVRESINSLRDSVNELPNGSVLRKILLELARLSEDSLNRFHIYGANGLKRAFKDMLSEVAEVYLQDEEDTSKIKNTTAWRKAVKHLKLFDSIAAKSMKYKPLLEKASQYLLGGG